MKDKSKLVRKIITNSKGHKQTVWVRQDGLLTTGMYPKGSTNETGAQKQADGSVDKTKQINYRYSPETVNEASKNIARKTGTRAEAVKTFANKHGIDIMKLASAVPEKISAIDFSSALVSGNPQKVKDAVMPITNVKEV